MPNSDTYWVSYHFIGRQLYEGGGVHYKRRPFLSPGKFYNQSIVSKKQVQKVLEKLKVSLGIKKTLKLLGVISKKRPVPYALSMKSANWARPGQPL